MILETITAKHRTRVIVDIDIVIISNILPLLVPIRRSSF